MSSDRQQSTQAFRAEVECAEPQDQRALKTADRHNSQQVKPEPARLGCPSHEVPCTPSNIA